MRLIATAAKANVFQRIAGVICKIHRTPSGSPRAVFPLVMMRLMGCLLGMCLCANAQFSGLATPGDGSRVYFATPLRQKNTVQPWYGKVFQVDSAGLQLVLSREVVAPPLGNSVGVLTNAYILNGASVSSDGKVFAAAGLRKCVGAGQFCTRQEYYTTTVTAGGQAKDFPGQLQLSANGAWAFGAGSNGIFRQAAYLFNVATGEEVALAIPRLDGEFGVHVASSGRSVADDGTVVYYTYREVVIDRAGDMRRIAVGTDAVIDRSGRTIVFVSSQSIRLADSAGTGSSLLISDGYAPSLSDDGGTLLYLSNRTGKPQMRIFKFNTSSDLQLTSDQTGIRQAVLSGDGSTVYAVTVGARLLKISVTTLAVQELIPRTPYLTVAGAVLAPGKLASLTGVGLTDISFTADPPLPESLDGIRVTIQGKTARMESVTPDAILVLVPPDVVPSTNGALTSAVDVALTSSSPFDSPHADLPIAQAAPEFLIVAGANVLLAAHQDWSALVSTDNPARPGEVIHTYAVGLGDTTPSVPYGEAAPAREPFARVTLPIVCLSLSNTDSTLPILFQGLAPNLAGFYQVDLRVPSPVPDGNFGLYCLWGRVGNGGPALSGTIPVRAQ